MPSRRLVVKSSLAAGAIYVLAVYALGRMEPGSVIEAIFLLVAMAVLFPARSMPPVADVTVLRIRS